MLISLPERYDIMVVALEESKDLTTLKPEELVGSLETHQQRRQRHGDHNQSVESAFQAKLTFRDDSKRGKPPHWKGTEKDISLLKMRLKELSAWCSTEVKSSGQTYLLKLCQGSNSVI
ncbi:uncharacterized protein LOC119987411 [Tripterygium wilfordii]|uniref:uncharacterized protein LOC119987411 n=1 Tax=Tripterygium wilfordii TaxID=458696 RepID=UPI0018F858B1|nr:uncharacterized protein LOC119987411 [Tripterygium wilfordii]